jgi:hypothetical protein
MRHLRLLLSLPTALLVAWVMLVWFGFGYFKLKSGQSEKPRTAQSGCKPSIEKSTLHHGVSTTMMPVNWRISAKDVDWADDKNHADLTGKYITCTIHIGEPVIEEDAVEQPVISPAEGKTTYLLKQNSKLGIPPNINAGMRVQVFPAGGVPVVADAHIIALICNGPCFPLLEVTPAESLLLQREDAAQLTVVLRK